MRPTALIVIAVLAIAILWLGEALLHVTGADVAATPRRAYAGDTVTLHARLTNRWGSTVPFRTPNVQWEIVEGEQHGRLLAREGSDVKLVCGSTGDVVVRARIEGLLLPIEITVHCFEAFAVNEAPLRAPCSPLSSRRGT